MVARSPATVISSSSNWVARSPASACQFGLVGARIRPGRRGRLLAAAQQLSYQQGVNVGVDALLSAANVARRSLYEHFGGKDGLIAEVLRRAAAEDLERYQSAIAAAG